MTREDIQKEILALKGNSFLLELPTGLGKTKLALDKVKSFGNIYNKLLIVVPRNILKISWENELKKWWSDCSLDITYTTYVSFPKHTGSWDIVIFDEAHHLSERCREALCNFNIKCSILLSATVNKTLKDELKEAFRNLTIYSKTFRTVIDNDILPDPKVYLWKLNLCSDIPSESIWKNTKAEGNPIECSWNDRWNFIKQKKSPVRIYCTEKQFYSDLDSQIDYWKKRFYNTNNPIAKNKWLKLCNNRLKWLSDKKLKYLYKLIPEVAKYRTLIFCGSIEQTELLGEYCINSKDNYKSLKNLSDFNDGKINHITSCNMINEGTNLVNCQIGIYANLNSSDTIIRQRLGRILRHKNPILIIPYFCNTREEELVNRMLQDYNPELVKIIINIKDINI